MNDMEWIVTFIPVFVVMVIFVGLVAFFVCSTDWERLKYFLWEARETAKESPAAFALFILFLTVIVFASYLMTSYLMGGA